MYLPLATGVLTNVDQAFAVPAGEVWVLYSVTLSQVAASAANNVSLAVGGTSLTAANVRRIYQLAAGIQSPAPDYPMIAVAAGSSLNISSSVTANGTNFSLNGLKLKTV